jgi:glycosyltransferase involved in cell wall biosynthesis
MPSIIYPPTVDFDYLRQRPQHMLRALAKKGLTSVYFNPNTGQSGKKRARGIEELEKNFFLISERTSLHLPNPLILYYSFPPHVDLIGKCREDMVIFDSIDEPAEEFRGWQRGYKESLQRANLVLASAETLYRTAKKYNRQVLKVMNGVDFEHFHKAAKISLPVPPELKSVPGPIVGYYGCISSWLDLDLIVWSAKALPKVNFVVIGPVLNSSFSEVPGNLHLIGHVRYEVLPEYLQLFDVCIIPFKITEMTKSCNPIKLWEYLAAGKPVVTTDMPETRAITGVYPSVNEEIFLENLKSSLEEKDNRLKKTRINIARSNSWDERASQVVRKIEEVTGWSIRR